MHAYYRIIIVCDETKPWRWGRKIVVHNHRVLHAKHLDLGVKCSDCHAGLVYGNLYGGQARPALERCVDRHAKRRPALVGCQSCHVQSIMPTGFLRLPR